MTAKTVDNPLQPLRSKKRWSAAAEINRIDGEVEASRRDSRVRILQGQARNLFFQRVTIRAKDALGRDLGAEITEAALRCAKGDLNVNAEGVHGNINQRQS